MASKIIQLHLVPDSEEVTEVHLRPATIGDGLQKKALELKGDAIAPADSEMSQLAQETYPICVSCVESPGPIREMSLDQFTDLLDEEIEGWYEAALALNPHWNKNLTIDLEDQKIIDKKWDIEDWLKAVYDNPDAEAGLMPAFEEKVFNFGRMSDELVEEAKKILAVLELTKFTWDINRVLEQPEELLDAVFYMKSIGERFHIQSTKGTRPVGRGVKEDGNKDDHHRDRRQAG